MKSLAHHLKGNYRAKLYKHLLIVTSIILIMMMLTSGLKAYPVSAAGENWLNGWANRVKLTIDHTKISASLTNFPVMVHISSSSGLTKANISTIFTSLGSNSSKIALTTADGSTQCYAEISRWDSANKQAYIWVKAPSISSTADTILYLYYDNTHADNTTYVGVPGSTVSRNVWDNNFTHVYHLSESLSGTSGEIKDSKGTNSGAGKGSGAKPVRVNSPTGYGQQTDGKQNWLEFPDSSDFSQPTTGYINVSFWINNMDLYQSYNGDYVRVWGKQNASGNLEYQGRYYPANYSTASVQRSLAFYIYEPNNGMGCGVGMSGSIGPTIFTANNQWHYVNVWINSSQIHEDVDNAKYSRESTYNVSSSVWGDPIKPANGNSPLYFGVCQGSRNFYGAFSEIRYSNVIRSSAWRQASYYSDLDSLISFGNIETKNTSTSLAVTTNAASNISTNGATINGSLSSLGTSSNVSVSFDYGTTTSYGKTTTSQSKSSTGAFSANISGLTSNTTYHFRAKAAGATTVYGSDVSFTTLAAIPSPTPTSTVTPTPTPTPTTTPTPTPNTTTFGLDNGDSMNANSTWFNAQRFQNTAGNGKITKLELLASDTSPTGYVRLGVYADNNGVPSNLLLDAGQVAASNGWINISGLNLPVTANDYYWLAFITQGLDVKYQSTGMPSNSHASYKLAYGALPTTFNNSIASINATPFVMRATVSATTPSTSVNTFGLSSGDILINKSGNVLDAMRYYNNAGSGTLTKLSLLVNDSTPTGKVRFGVYADNSGKPGKRLLDAGEATVINGWVTISNLNLSVSANTYYWLVFDLQNSNTVVYQSSQATNSHYWVNRTYGALPTNFPTSGLSSNNSSFVMQASVTVK